ncbi:hypothetical protein [Leclercia adecarboxylata]|nr:hypothetical protein [Leclercia adecarboxylata]
MAVVLQQKKGKFTADNDIQNLTLPGVKRHEMQGAWNEMPKIRNE